MKFLLLPILLIATPVLAEKIGPQNSPFAFNKAIKTQMITSFEELPVSAALADDRYGWSETYWPSNKGSVAYRWNSLNPQPFKEKLLSLAELKSLTPKEMSELSPAELYDISQGDYNYSLTKKVLSMVSPNDLWWEGICHGWAPAAVNYPEPAQVTITNKDGIKVPFGSSDVKGLLALYEAYNYDRTLYASIGVRCAASGKVPGEGDSRDRNQNPPSPEEANTPACTDVNPASFHLAITNLIGIHSMGFVADIDRYNDVWNQPITAYSYQVKNEEPLGGMDSMNGIARKLRIAMNMTYGEELKFWTPELAAQGHLNFVSKLPVTGTPHQKFLSKNYEYILELDAKDNVVGGEWVSETRPDFLWLIQREPKFRSTKLPLSGLNAIYRPIRR